MATFNDPRSLLRHQTKRFQRTYQRIVVEHEQMTKEMLFEARDMTSGGVKTKTLRKLGHPFGRSKSGKKRGRGKARLPNLPINVQTGRLRKSFRRDFVGSASGKRVYTVYATAPYAPYVLAPGGTTKMVARGFWREYRKRWKKKNFDLLVRIRKMQRGEG